MDDELAVIGSANLDMRGWSGDNQANVCIFDTPASAKKPSFAQRLRMRLWSEHLQVPESAVIDGVASASLWDDRKAAPNATVALWGARLAGTPDIPDKQRYFQWLKLLSGLSSEQAHPFVDLSADGLRFCGLDTPSAPGDRPDPGIW